MTSTFPTAKLSEIAYLNPTLGGRLPEDELVSFVPMASVSAETAKVETTQDRPYSEVSKGFTPFLSGDVLVAKITPCFENGKIAQANLPRRNGFGSTEFHVVRSRPDASDARYLHHYLRLKDVRTEGQRRMTGSGGQRRVPASFLSELRVPAPPLEEQRRVAAILDQAETLRTQRRAALAKLDSLTQSLFLDMFGDRAADTSMWPKTELDDVAGLVTGYPFRSEEYVGLDQGIKLCRGVNVLPGRLDWRDMACWPHAKVAEVETFQLQAGDIVMAMDRPWISGGFKLSQVDAADCPMLLVQRVARIRPKSDVANEYLFAVLSHVAFTRHSKPTETTVPHISPKDIRSFAFPLPPLPLQQTFATRIQAIEALKATHRAALAELDALFASLQQRAFRGEL